MTAARYGVSLWGDENVLKWVVVMVSQLFEGTEKIIELYTSNR